MTNLEIKESYQTSSGLKLRMTHAICFTYNRQNSHFQYYGSFEELNEHSKLYWYKLDWRCYINLNITNGILIRSKEKPNANVSLEKRFFFNMSLRVIQNLSGRLTSKMVGGDVDVNNNSQQFSGKTQ